MEDNKMIEVIQKYIDKKVKQEIGRRISKSKKEKENDTDVHQGKRLC